MVIILALALLPSATPEAQALGTYTIRHGEVLTTSVTADTILLLPGTTAFWAADISLMAMTRIDIRGAFLNSADGPPGEIRLVSERDIIVSGSILGREGSHRADITTNMSITGEDGEGAANIYIQWGPLGSFTLAEGARIETRLGGHGANVTVLPDEGSPANVTGTGGRGGAGGKITLNGLVGANYGTLVTSVGGYGGWANVSTQPTFSPEPWTNISAVGGPSGPAGSVEGTWFGACMPNCGNHVVNHIGGDGGWASAHINEPRGRTREVADSAAPSNGGGTGGSGGTGGNGGTPPPGTRGSDLCGTSFARGADGQWGGQAGQNAEARNDGCITGNGGSGCPGGPGGRGGNAEAYAGNGRAGSTTGGNGGWARAFAGPGGTGGSGASTCAGGTGGTGGYAYARGGDGGNGGCWAGKGGTASAAPGTGGYGGPGNPYGPDGSLGHPTATPGRDGQGGWCPG